MIKKTNILIFGDSIVYGMGDKFYGGWVNRLRLKLEKRDDYYYDVYNLGIPDDNSLDILKRFEEEIVHRYYQGRLIIIFSFGANDSSQTETYYEVFSNRLYTIFNIAKNYTNEIAFINIPKAIDIDVEGRLGVIAKVRNKKTEMYNVEIKSACLINCVNYIDVRDELRLEHLSEDGIHPNDKGHEKISEIVYDYITKP